jgi:hypothetical protein
MTYVCPMRIHLRTQQYRLHISPCELSLSSSFVQQELGKRLAGTTRSPSWLVRILRAALQYLKALCRRLRNVLCVVVSARMEFRFMLFHYRKKRVFLRFWLEGVSKHMEGAHLPPRDLRGHTYTSTVCLCMWWIF